MLGPQECLAFNMLLVGYENGGVGHKKFHVGWKDKKLEPHKKSP